MLATSHPLRAMCSSSGTEWKNRCPVIQPPPARATTTAEQQRLGSESTLRQHAGCARRGTLWSGMR